MSILLRCALVLAFLTGMAETANAYARINPEQQPARQILPERGRTLWLKYMYGCKELPDLVGYFSQPSPEMAKRFFAEKRKNNLACASIGGPVKVVSYTKPIKSADEVLRCVIQIELFDSRTNRDMTFFVGWAVHDRRAMDHCIPE